MPLSHNDRRHENREREFQARILAVLERPRRNRFLAIINSPAFIWVLTAIFITLGSMYYTNYRQCVADGRQVLSIYKVYGLEIRHRQDEITNAIDGAATMADVRRSLQKNAYLISDLKDKTMLELQAVYREAYLRIDRSRISTTPEHTLISSPLFPRFSLIMNGYLDPTFTDADLPDLKKFAALLGSVNNLISLRDFMISYEIECTCQNVLLIMQGFNPVLVEAVAFSTSEGEKRSLPINVLPKPQ